MPVSWKTKIAQFASDVSLSSNSIVVLAGAGLSRASGISTFRDKDGWWNKLDPMQLATPEGFKKDPALVWEWYCHRIRNVFSAAPNSAHHAIAALERKGRLKLLVTQNVDGLHRRAAISKYAEVHGTLLTMSCTRCGTKVQLSSSPCDQAKDGVPRCRCGALYRPDVVWFGESLPRGVIDRSTKAIEESELLIVAGTSGLVYPVAFLPRIAFERGIPIVELNIERTPISEIASETILAPVEKSLPYLVEHLK